MDALAFEDALRHLDNAAALVDEDGRFELAQLQAGALRGAGRVDDALAVLDARARPDRATGPVRSRCASNGCSCSTTSTARPKASTTSTALVAAADAGR